MPKPHRAVNHNNGTGIRWHRQLLVGGKQYVAKTAASAQLSDDYAAIWRRFQEHARDDGALIVYKPEIS